MNGKDIEQFYNKYKYNLYESKYIEKSIFAESYNYQKWETGLREKSEILRGIFEDNEKLLNDTIRTLLKNPEQLNDDLVTALLQHIMYFTYEEHYDYEVTERVLNLMEPYIENQAKDWQKIKFYFLKGFMLAKGQIRNYGYPWYEKMTAVCSEWMEADRDGSKERLLDAYIYRVLCTITYENDNPGKILEQIDEALRQWRRPEAMEMLETIYGTVKDVERYIRLRQELIEYLQVFVISKENIEKLPAKMTERLFLYLEKEYNNGVAKRRLNARVFLAYHQIRFYSGQISEAEYVKALDLYEKPSPFFYPCNMNFEMRGRDLFSCLEQHRYYCNSFTYANLILPEKLRFKQSKIKCASICMDIEDYVCGIVPMENTAYMDNLLLISMQAMSKHLSESKVFRVLETGILHRQISTAIHMNVVSKLASVFTEHIIEHNPKLLIGVFDYTTENQIRQKKKEIISFVEKAGMCHDVGKVLYSDIFNLQYRGITDDEFKIIKRHPVTGQKIVEAIDAFRPYSDVVAGHHLYADRNGGYPENAKIKNASNTILIDLITICDSIDAAMDIWGRSYAKGKTFTGTLEELQAQKGTRYSEELVDFLCNSKELLEQMEAVTGKKKVLIYRGLYTRRVKARALEKEYVEKYFRNYKRKDVHRVTAFLEHFAEESIRNKLSDLKKYEEIYLVKNIHKELLGVFLGKKITLENKEGIMIDLILVKDTARHIGIGRKLLDYAEEKARAKGYDFVAMEKKEELGSMERYMWIQGYSVFENGLLIKRMDNKGERENG